MKILLDTGPSARGWHRLEAHLRCGQLFSWGYGQGGSNVERAAKFPPTFPLVRGSIGHAGLAHLYARVKWLQDRGETDPRALAECEFHDPATAMRLVAEKFGALGVEALPIADRAVRAYAARYGAEPFRVVDVEVPAETIFEGYRYTARIDLVLEDRAGKVWVVDHKFVSRLGGSVADRYTLSGQFLGLSHLGARLYGDRFGGLRLNLVGVNPIAFERLTPEPAPWMLERFPSVVRHAEEGIARVEAALAAGEPVEASPSEHTCLGSYGKCPAFHLCRFGPEVAPELVVNFGERSGV